MKVSHGLGTQRESCKKSMAYYLFFSLRFWVKEPGHSESDFAKTRYTSIVARVQPDELRHCRN